MAVRGICGHMTPCNYGDAALCWQHKAACQTGITASQSKRLFTSTHTHLGLTHTPLRTMGGTSITHTHTHTGVYRAHLHAGTCTHIDTGVVETQGHTDLTHNRRLQHVKYLKI